MFRYRLNAEETDSNFEGLLEFSDWSLERRLGAPAREHVNALRSRLEQCKKELPKERPFVMAVRDKTAEHLEDLAIQRRGNPRDLGEIVARGVPDFLQQEPITVTGSGRLALAQAIATHPLTARVIVQSSLAVDLWEGLGRHRE